MPSGSTDESPSKRQRQQRATARGTIARLRLHNFMSYRDAEITDPGAQLNCIVGPNGTGKSSIVCAMCVGLGGNLKITERGDQLDVCVHGKGTALDERGAIITKGFVETELVDGSGPGRNLTIRLDFDLENKTKWTMNGEKCIKQKVLDKMKELNIQVENPLQFLPQDKVGQFSNLSPVDLLKHTEMAIGPEVYAQHQALMALGKELEALKQRQVSEQDGLDDLQARNKALEKDVQRFRKLQENKERRDHLQGKVMWIESEVLLAKGEEAKKEYGEARARHKAAKKEEEDKDKELGPLNAAKDRLATAIKGEAATLRRADAERASIGEKNDATADKREEDVEKLGKVDREAEKLMKAVTKAREDLEREEDRLRKEKEDLAASNPNEDPEARRVRLKKVVEERKKQHRKLQNDFKEADAQVRPLRETYDNAKEALDEAQSIHMRKRKFIADKARPAARFGVDLDKAGIGVDRAIGPLMLHIDVPEPSYQHLVEQAINAKYAMCFLARDDATRDELSRRVKTLGQEGSNVNIYRAAHGARYTPFTVKGAPRPTAAQLKKFGVTSWLDDAVKVPADVRDEVFCALRDLTRIDRYLLGSAKVDEESDKLIKHLADFGIDAVTIISPNKVYRVERSRHGNKEVFTQVRLIHPPNKCFSLVHDQNETDRLDKAAVDARRAVDEQLRKRDTLTEQIDYAERDKNDAFEQLQLAGKAGDLLRTIEGRVEVLRKTLAKKEAEQRKYSSEEQRAKLQKQVAHGLAQEVRLMAQYGKAACAMCAAATEEHGLTLGKTYAVARHAEASESAVELKKTIAELDRVMREKKVAGKEAVEAATRKIEAARKKAKELEKEDATELRSPEGDALWDSMPHDLGQLEAEIEGLEEEIEAGGDDSGNTLAAYTRRLSAIEAQQKKVDATEEEIGAMSGRLATMTAAWKPELERMIGGVDKEFASYFSRFGCRGEVALSDGRETPQSADDFAKYKVHIRVAWRDEEELHVLGEGGRDSGGERSVATMIYLISLQGINPAPFRVVDEINQAMDSTNERFVFECITHACRSGGKQYFLLTPKLLPDLDYGEETVLQLVMNGPYNLKREALSLDRFC